MNSYRTKLGRDLAIDDVLIWHTNGKCGMRVDQISTEGTERLMVLEGRKVDGIHVHAEVILDDEEYLLHHDSPQARWPL